MGQILLTILQLDLAALILARIDLQKLICIMIHQNLYHGGQLRKIRHPLPVIPGVAIFTSCILQIYLLGCWSARWLRECWLTLQNCQVIAALRFCGSKAGLQPKYCAWNMQPAASHMKAASSSLCNLASSIDTDTALVRVQLQVYACAWQSGHRPV